MVDDPPPTVAAGTNSVTTEKTPAGTTTAGTSTAQEVTTDFRQVMSGHAAGVAVVTAGRAGSPAGLTVTSLTSFSDLPPSICFNVGVTARSHQPVINADAIGVHMLTTGQSRLAEVFSSPAEDKFSGLDWSWDGSVPRLPDTLAYLLCLPVAVFRHGDHSLVVAEVKRMEARKDTPLVYLHRRLGWRLVNQ